MGLDIFNLGVSKTYARELFSGGGASVGKNVTISSIDKIEGGNRITFQYTLDNGDVKTSTLDVMDGVDGKPGADGKSVVNASIDGQNNVTFTLSDNSIIPAGTIKTVKGDRGDDGTTPQFTIGNVTTVQSDEPASANITGTSANPILNLNIPKGKDGSDINSSDEKVKLTSSSSDAHYLEDFIDNSTIEIDSINNKLIVKKIEGLNVTAAEINFLSGITSNIQEQIDSLGKSMTMYGVFDTKADLLASLSPAPVDGNTAIVVVDETNENKQMTYIYIASSSTWTKVAESTISIRNFITNPIDLDSETFGILKKEKIDNAIARLSDVLDKTTYKGSSDGVVKSADTIKDLIYTISELNNCISNSHAHINKQTLDKIIENGLGNRILTDKGEYKELLVLSSTEPLDTYVLWADNTNSDKIILKIHDGDKWVSISGTGGGNSIIVDAGMSDVSENPVQNRVVKKYIDDKEVLISQEANNAIVKLPDNGLFVADKTNEIQSVDDKVEKIAKYQKYLNTELEYCFLMLQNDIKYSPNSNEVIPFKNHITGNMEYNGDNYSIFLKAGKTYKLESSVVVDEASGFISYSFYDLSNDISFGSGLSVSVNYENNLSNSNLSYIHTPNEDCWIQVKVSDGGGININNKSSYFIVSEINRQIAIDPVEYVNSKNGIEDTPVGHIVAHMGNNAPKHYLVCDGGEYNIIDYPYLAQHFEDEFGSINYFGGDGISTFAVPDLRGEFLRGSGTAVRNTGSGANVGEHQEPTEHLGTYLSKTPRFGVRMNPNSDHTYYTSEEYMHYDKSIKTSNGYYSISGTGSSSPSNYAGIFTSRPTSTSVLYCIKYEPTYYMKIEGKDIYSTDEKIIGYWIDNKPLYQKTINLGEFPNNTTKSVLYNIENVDNIWISDGFATNGSVVYCIPHINVSGMNASYTVVVDKQNESINIKTLADWSGITGYVTVRYTKTSD